MISPYECEVRYRIPSIEIFENRLLGLGAELLCAYALKDYYYCPRHEKWDPLQQNVRIRSWVIPNTEPTQIYFAKNEIVTIEGVVFKRALYEQGKVPLFVGDANTCDRLLVDLGFKYWLTVEKTRAYRWRLEKHGFETVVEYIYGFGWSGELEFDGEDQEQAKEKIANVLSVLGIPKERVTHKPLSIIVNEERKTLERANEIVCPHGLVAEFLEDMYAVGVGGDQRSYSPVLCLIGKFPGHEILEELSRKISNETPVARVTFEIMRKK